MPADGKSARRAAKAATSAVLALSGVGLPIGTLVGAELLGDLAKDHGEELARAGSKLLAVVAGDAVARRFRDAFKGDPRLQIERAAAAAIRDGLELLRDPAYAEWFDAWDQRFKDLEDEDFGKLWGVGAVGSLADRNEWFALIEGSLKRWAIEAELPGTRVDLSNRTKFDEFDPKLREYLKPQLWEVLDRGFAARLTNDDLIGVIRAEGRESYQLLLSAINREGQATRNKVSEDGDLTRKAVEEGVEAIKDHIGPRPPAEPRNLDNVVRPVEHFTGRAELVAEVRTLLAEHRRVVLHGYPGVGKSQTALRYAEVHRGDYSQRRRLQAETLDLLDQGYWELARDLELPEAKGERDPAAIRDAVRLRLEGDSGWLLIFDNAARDAAIPWPSYLPRDVDVLFTSRSREWGKFRFQAKRVDDFTSEEAIEFLRERTGRDEPEAADSLAERLGRLPLALEQAAAYMDGPAGCGYAEYEALLDGKEADAQALLDRHDGADPHEGSVWATILLAHEALPGPEKELAERLAFLAPEGIPGWLFDREHVEHLPEGLRGAVECREGLGRLAALALIRRDGEQAWAMHRLVQEVLRLRLADGQGARLRECVAWLEAVFPYKVEVVESWGPAGDLLPHVELLVERVGPEDETAELSRLLNKAKIYLEYVQSDLKKSRRYAERALRIAETVYGPDHPTVATLANNLGAILQAQGDLAGAKEWTERALRIAETVYGPDHPTVATCASNLGQILKAQGDLAGAKEWTERALRIGETVYGPDHPTVATLANNLGTILKAQGDLAGAKEWTERALRIDETVYGLDHPEVATDASNLGAILQAQGDLAGAKEWTERALRIAETVYGPDHPNVAIRASNLGTILQAQGDLAGAKEWTERALRIDETVYGPDHPEVATDAGNLGVILAQQGDLDGARERLRGAVDVFERRLGAEHPTTVATRRYLEGLG